MIKNIKISLIPVFLFLVNPFLGLFGGAFAFFRNRKSSFIMAASLALIFVYLPVMRDTAANFFYVQDRDFNHLYNKIAYEAKQILNIDYFYVIYFYTIIILWTWFYTIRTLGKKLTSAQWIVLASCGFLLIIYRNIMDIQRCYLACSLLFFYFFYLFNHDRIATWVKCALFLFFFILTTSIHPYSFIFFILYGVSFILAFCLKERNLNLKVIMAFIPIAMIFSYLSQSVFLFVLAPFYFNEAYLISQFGYDTQYPFYMVLWHNQIDILLSILSILLAALSYNQAPKKIIYAPELLIILIGLLNLSVFMYFTLFERTSVLLMIFSIYLVSKTTNDKLFFILKIIFILLIAIRFCFFNVDKFGNVFTEKGYHDVLPNAQQKIEMQLKPLRHFTFELLDIHQNGYSDIYLKKEAKVPSLDDFFEGYDAMKLW